jgi:hypothetical protein
MNSFRFIIHFNLIMLHIRCGPVSFMFMFFSLPICILPNYYHHHLYIYTKQFIKTAAFLVTVLECSKGSTWNDEVTKDTPDLASAIPDGDAVFQIHCLERSAYASVLRAFVAVTNHLSWVYLSAVLNFFLYTVVITHFSLISLDYHICVALSLHFLHHILTARSYSYRSCFLLN